MPGLDVGDNWKLSRSFEIVRYPIDEAMGVLAELIRLHPSILA